MKPDLLLILTWTAVGSVSVVTDVEHSRKIPVP